MQYIFDTDILPNTYGRESRAGQYSEVHGRCPQKGCGMPACMKKHGFYSRNILLKGHVGVLRVRRYKCDFCGISACRKGYSVRFTNLQDMLIDLTVAENAGTFNRVLAGYRNARLLIVDDWLMFEIAKDSEAAHLNGLIEARKYEGALIVCS